jgi:hypothetical protein
LESELGYLHRNKDRNTLPDNRESNPPLHSAVPLGAQRSYDGKRLACSSIVAGLTNNEERALKVVSGRKHKMESNNIYICPIIHVGVSEVQLQKAIALESSNNKLSTRSANGLYH